MQETTTQKNTCPGHGPNNSYHCDGDVRLADGRFVASCLADCPKHAALRLRGEQVWASLATARDCYGNLTSSHYHVDILGCVQVCYEPLNLLVVA